MDKGDTALAVGHGSTEQFGGATTDGAVIRITESSVVLSVLPAAAAEPSTDSGISSAISEEDDTPADNVMGSGSSVAVAAQACPGVNCQLMLNNLNSVAISGDISPNPRFWASLWRWKI